MKKAVDVPYPREPLPVPLPGAPSPEAGGYARVTDSLTFAFLTRSGRELSITLTAEPVFDLRRSRQAGQRLKRVVRHVGDRSALSMLGRRSLEGVDLKRIDVETLRHGQTLLRPQAEALTVSPVFWRTASSAPGRFALTATAPAPDTAAAGLVFEILGGLESARLDTLTAVIGDLEDRQRDVILHVAPDVGVVRRMAAARPGCLALDFAGVEQAGARDWDRARALIGAARQAAPRVLLVNLRPDRGEAATMAGATHAVFAPMTRMVI